MKGFNRSTFALLVFIMIPMLAQAQAITGRVTDANTGVPVALAQVVITNLQLGGLSQVNGRYVLLNVPPGTHTITVERIGFGTVSQEVTVSQGATATLNFELSLEAIILDAIVATGLVDPVQGALSPITVGVVGPADLQVMSIGSAMANLRGMLPGVAIKTASGRPGSDVSIQLRTRTSTREGGEPLIVIDGVIQAEGLGTTNIPSSDIESIEVVKGAAAASLYGSRASGGVISITTNRGRSLEFGETRVTARTEFGRSRSIRGDAQPTHHQFLLDPTGAFYVDLAGNEVTRENRVEPPTIDAYMDQAYPGQLFDNFGNIFAGGNYSQQSASIQRNSLETNYAITLDRYAESGALINNDGYERLSFRINLDHRLSDVLSLGVGGFHSQDWNDGINASFQTMLLAPPDIDVRLKDEDGNFLRAPDPTVPYENPLWRQDVRDGQERRARTQASGRLSWEPIYWLSMRGNVSYDRQDRSADEYIPKGTPTSITADRPSDGSLEYTQGLTEALNAEVQISARNDFGVLNARTTVRALMERDKIFSTTAEGSNFFVGGVPNLNAAGTRNARSSDQEIRASGYLWDNALTYDNKYVGTVLVRRDGSSLFGEDERWHTYYRVAGAWRVGEEDWFNIPQVGELKLTYARGTAGGRPRFAAQYQVWNVTSRGISKRTLGNPELKPERTTEQEVSLQTDLFQKIGLDVTYAWQTTEDQLLDLRVPSLTGYRSQWQNVGVVKGHTTEVTLRANFANTPNFGWTSSFIFDRSRAKMVEWPVSCEAPAYTRRCEGVDLMAIYASNRAQTFADIPGHDNGSLANSGRTDEFMINDEGRLVWVGAGNSYTEGLSKGLWGTSGVIGGRTYNWGMPFYLRNEGGSIRREQLAHTNSYNFGWVNTFRVGSFQIFSQVQASVGGSIALHTEGRQLRLAQRSREMDQFGKPEELKKPIAYYEALEGGRGNPSYMADADYLKLRSLSVNYTVSADQLGRFGMQALSSLKIGLVGRNLIAIDSCTCPDPEQGLNVGNGASPMLTYSREGYPTARILSFEVEAIL